MRIDFILNGEAKSVDADPTRRLLDLLRDDLKLTGTKEGCGEGECGSCSVIVNGELVNSCLVSAMTMIGKEVLTIEGFSTQRRFEAIKAGFESAGSVQCGFCTPGMVLAAEALLSKNPHPTRGEVLEAIEGNLCRCTGYSMIADGILEASKVRVFGFLEGLYAGFSWRCLWLMYMFIISLFELPAALITDGIIVSLRFLIVESLVNAILISFLLTALKPKEVKCRAPAFTYAALAIAVLLQVFM